MRSDPIVTTTVRDSTTTSTTSGGASESRVRRFVATTRTRETPRVRRADTHGITRPPPDVVVPLSSKPYFTGPTFDDTFHIRLNMQVGSKYWGWAEPKYTRDAFSYKVDWVRVYQGNELLGR